MEKDIELLLDAISRIVQQSDTIWSKKRDAIKAALEERNDDATLDFEEFISWFPEEDENE